MEPKLRDYPCFYFATTKGSRAEQLKYYATVASMLGHSPESAAEVSGFFVATSRGKLFDGRPFSVEELEKHQRIFDSATSCNSNLSRKFATVNKVGDCCCVICPLSPRYANNRRHEENLYLKAIIESPAYLKEYPLESSCMTSLLPLSLSDDVGTYPTVPFNALALEQIRKMSDVNEQNLVREMNVVVTAYLQNIMTMDLSLPSVIENFVEKTLRQIIRSAEDVSEQKLRSVHMQLIAKYEYSPLRPVFPHDNTLKESKNERKRRAAELSEQSHLNMIVIESPDADGGMMLVAEEQAILRDQEKETMEEVVFGDDGLAADAYWEYFNLSNEAPANIFDEEIPPATASENVVSVTESSVEPVKSAPETEDVPEVLEPEELIFVPSEESSETENEITETEVSEPITEEDLERKYWTDVVTGLINRNGYEKKVQSVDVASLGIISIDVNDLKVTNDTLGHSEGDRLLKDVADSLCEIWGHDCCYRTGGDEFIVLLSGANKDTVYTEISAFHGSLEQKKRSASVGFADYSDLEGTVEITVEGILKLSDERMYEAKRKFKQARAEAEEAAKWEEIAAQEAEKLDEKPADVYDTEPDFETTELSVVESNICNLCSLGASAALYNSIMKYSEPAQYALFLRCVSHHRGEENFAFMRNRFGCALCPKKRTVNCVYPSLSLRKPSKNKSKKSVFDTAFEYYSDYKLSAEMQEYVIDCTDNQKLNLIQFISEACNCTEISVECVEYFGVRGLLFYVEGRFYFFNPSYGSSGFLKPLFGDAKNTKFYSVNPVQVHACLYQIGLKRVRIESLSALFSTVHNLEILAPIGLIFNGYMHKALLDDMYAHIMPYYPKVYKDLSERMDLQISKAYERGLKFEWALGKSRDISRIARGHERNVLGGNYLHYRLTMRHFEDLNEPGTLFLLRIKNENITPLQKRRVYEYTAGKLAASTSRVHEYSYLLSLSEENLSYYVCYESNVFYDEFLACLRSSYRELIGSTPDIAVERTVFKF